MDRTMETPLRYYDLLESLEKMYEEMDANELLAASYVLGNIQAYFLKKYFKDQTAIDSKCLVKTLEDAYTNLLEDYLHKEKIERNRKALEEVD
jgi:hypothetical protein